MVKRLNRKLTQVVGFLKVEDGATTVDDSGSDMKAALATPGWSFVLTIFDPGGCRKTPGKGFIMRGEKNCTCVVFGARNHLLKFR